MLSSFYLCRKYLLVISLFSFMVYSQDANIKADLPNISPPAPTAAALMKFEEVPVDHYTGIPDISIPLYDGNTLSKDLSMNIALKYHPSSIPLQETAAFTGLGWNLIAGGTVSRTVRGLPDEILYRANGTTARKVGIYYNDIESNNANYFYDRVNLTPYSPQDQIDRAQEFLFGAFEKGSFDTEHDLHQYNFMGHTGRFYIKKITLSNDPDGSLNTYVIIKLDNDNNIKIALKQPTRPDLNFGGFTFYDDNGYSFSFTSENAEWTEENVAYFTEPFGEMGDINSNFTDEQFNIRYISSYQLSQITDNNAQPIVSLSYQNATEIIRKRTSEFNFLHYIGPGDTAIGLAEERDGPCEVEGLMPRRAQVAKTITTVTRKPIEINILNKSKIKFTLTSDRDDTNINEGAVRLTGMTVENKYGQLIKQYAFDHDYAIVHRITTDGSNQDLKRLVLTSIIEKGVGTTEELHRTLTYKNQYITGTQRDEDYWGYYKRDSGSRETDPESCMTGALESMTLPTGGSVFFMWGPNTYSYIGSTFVSNFTRDDYDGADLIANINPDLTHGNTGFGTINPSFTEASRLAYIMPDSKGVQGSFTITQVGTSNAINIDAGGINGINDGTAARSGGIKLSRYAQYQIRFTPRNPDIPLISGLTATIYFDGPRVIGSGEQWQYGGGIRINKISYYNVQGDTPVKEKLYDYNFFNLPNRSSGALVFSKPIFDYERTKPVRLSGQYCTSAIASQTYDTNTSYNNLHSIRTRGTDVGYKNVRVWETNNGKSEYIYTSPIDAPENDYTLQIPAIATHNYDYKRGLLTNEKHYKQVGSTYTILNEKIYNYPLNQMDPKLVVTGKRSRMANINFGANNFDTYAAYKDCALRGIHCSTGGYGLQLIVYDDYDVWEAYGWPKLTYKTNKDYFYEDGSSTPNILSTTENYTYEPTNKRVSIVTNTNSVGESLLTEFVYDANSASRNRIGLIKSITSKRNSVILDKKEITYSNSDWGTTNTAYLPKTISVLKGTNSLESRLQFTKYDEFSNPLEAKMENGTPVCYIWGYDKSLPIAVIENLSYDIISQTLINEAQTASNTTPNPLTDANFIAKETTVLTKLAALRASLPASAMVKTYTYLKPLVGPTTIIDERGSKTTYTYDGFGRLIQVKDNQGKIVTETKYNYIPQPE